MQAAHAAADKQAADEEAAAVAADMQAADEEATKVAAEKQVADEEVAKVAAEKQAVDEEVAKVAAEHQAAEDELQAAEAAIAAAEASGDAGALAAAQKTKADAETKVQEAAIAASVTKAKQDQVANLLSAAKAKQDGAAKLAVAAKAKQDEAAELAAEAKSKQDGAGKSAAEAGAKQDEAAQMAADKAAHADQNERLQKDATTARETKQKLKAKEVQDKTLLKAAKEADVKSAVALRESQIKIRSASHVQKLKQARKDAAKRERSSKEITAKSQSKNVLENAAARTRELTSKLEEAQAKQEEEVTNVEAMHSDGKTEGLHSAQLTSMQERVAKSQRIVSHVTKKLAQSKKTEQKLREVEHEAELKRKAMAKQIADEQQAMEAKETKRMNELQQKVTEVADRAASRRKLVGMHTKQDLLAAQTMGVLNKYQDTMKLRSNFSAVYNEACADESMQAAAVQVAIVEYSGAKYESLRNQEAADTTKNQLQTAEDNYRRAARAFDPAAKDAAMLQLEHNKKRFESVSTVAIETGKHSASLKAKLEEEWAKGAEYGLQRAKALETMMDLSEQVQEAAAKWEEEQETIVDLGKRMLELKMQVDEKKQQAAAELATSCELLVERASTAASNSIVRQQDARMASAEYNTRKALKNKLQARTNAAEIALLDARDAFHLKEDAASALNAACDVAFMCADHRQAATAAASGEYAQVSPTCCT